MPRSSAATGADLLDPPRDLVDRCPPARGPPAPPVHDPLRAPLLIGVAQPAKVPFAHPQQLRRHAAQLPRLMQPNRIDDPGHSDLRQHAIPPAQTGQIVCYKTRTYRVSPAAELNRSGRLRGHPIRSMTASSSASRASITAPGSPSSAKSNPNREPSKKRKGSMPRTPQHASTA